MGAPPPSSGNVFVRIQILAEGEHTPQGGDFWNDVLQVLGAWGQEGDNAPLLGWKRFPANTHLPQLGYDFRAGTRARNNEPNAAIEFERNFLNLRLGLLNLLSSARYNKHVKEWERGVTYVNRTTGREKPLSDCLPT